jgi:quinoprotein glucose dehydrogenase
MTHRFRISRKVGIVIAAVTLGGALAAYDQARTGGQSAALVRGNVPGEWRYWGGDAWSTRYSPLDQINATNFDKLEQAWQWNAGSFSADEYYRTTPLYANGRLFTVARHAARFTAVVVLPTPPFWFARAITRVTTREL